MKICKVKFLLICLIAAALCCTWFAGAAFAEDPLPEPTGIQAKNFVYSAEFAPSNDQLTVYFGASATNGWQVTADKEQGTTVLSRVTVSAEKPSEPTVTALKTASASPNNKLTLVVNEGVAKVFADESNVACLVCALTDYDGGIVGCESAVNTQLARTDNSTGDFCCGYTVQKVINVTDGHTKLGATDYSVQKGVLTVSREYLQTLESGTSYVFRAVTDFTDFDFVVMADFASVSVAPSSEKFYRGNDVVLELSGDATVSKVVVDGEEVATDGYTQQDGRVVISASALSAVADGKHGVTLFTDHGRPKTEFNLVDAVETLTEMEEQATHIFFWVDISVFGALILVYVVFVIVKKCKKS